MTPPSVPQNVKAIPGNNSVTLTWEAPSSSGTWTAAGFDIVVKGPTHTRFGNILESSDSTLTSYVFNKALVDNIETGVNGEVTEFQIRAVSRQGMTSNYLFSSWVTVTVTVGVPAAIADSALTVTPGVAKLDLSWTAPSGNGSAVSGYDVHATSSTSVADDAAVQTGAYSAGWKAVSRSGTTASQSITGLTNTAHRVRVRAKNTHGNGDWVLGTGTPTAPTGPATLWSGTLTVKALTDNDIFGCNNAETAQASKCSTAATLTDDDFTLSGTTWEITRVLGTVSPGDLTVRFNNDVQTALDGYNVCVGTTALAFSSASHTGSNNQAAWSSTVTSGWSAGDTVSLRIATSCAQQTRSTNANLSALTAGSATSSTGTFTNFSIGTFGAATTTYTASVANARTHVKLTPTVADTGKATVGVRKGTQGSFTTVTSGQASSALALDVGANTFVVRVTAEDTTRTKDYTVTVTRRAAQTLSTNANLSGLTAGSSTSSTGTFTDFSIGTFGASTTTYTASVANDQTHVKLTPTVADTGKATVGVRKGTSGNFSSVTDGTASGALVLDVGANTLVVRVTAEDTTRTKDYTVTVTRRAAQTLSTNANLSGLTAGSNTSSGGQYTDFSIGTFEASTTTYTASVANAQTHVKLTPTVADTGKATVGVRKGSQGSFTTVTSGQASGAIALDVGSNTLVVRVTAEDGSTTKDYTVTITRQAAVQNTATVSLSASPNAVNENNHMFVTATLSAPLPNAVGIPLTVTNNSAEDGDYVVDGSPKFSFPPNSTISKISISANNDADMEDETFTVSLGMLPRSVTAGTPSSLRIKIFDDDKPNERNVRLWASPNPVPEGSPVTVRVLLYLDSQPTVLQEDVTIPVVVTRVTSETEDHGKIESITIPSGSSSATGEIWTKRDADTEDERFWVALGTLPSPWTRGSPGSVVRISENAGRTSPGTGGGGGGGGTPPPAGDSSSPEEPQDPDQPDDCGENDRENLVRLYVTADGDNWNDNTDWISEEPLGDWHGVDTDEEENVVSLRLSDNGLSGGIPEELLLCFSELKELALWGNDDLSAEIPEGLLLAVERAALREIAEMLDLNPEWFDDYEDPFNFEDWHEGVTTDEDERVVELDLPGEIPGSIISQFRKLREIMTTTGGGGCALSPEGSSALSLFLMTLAVFAVVVRKRVRR